MTQGFGKNSFKKKEKRHRTNDEKEIQNRTNQCTCGPRAGLCGGGVDCGETPVDGDTEGTCSTACEMMDNASVVDKDCARTIPRADNDIEPWPESGRGLLAGRGGGLATGSTPPIMFVLSESGFSSGLPILGRDAGRAGGTCGGVVVPGDIVGVGVLVLTSSSGDAQYVPMDAPRLGRVGGRGGGTFVSTGISVTGRS